MDPELEVTVTVNVARSADEAERLARGENVTVRREGGAEDDAAEAAEAAKAAAEKFFEPGAVKELGEEGAKDDDAKAEPAAKS